MLSDDGVFDFLAQPENLPVALEISTYIDKLKNICHRNFWNKFNLKMKGFLVESDLNKSWEYKIKLRENAYLKPWERNKIVPIGQKEGKPFLYAFFGQTSIESHFRIYWGVEWNSKPEYIKNSTLTKLTDYLNMWESTSGWSNSVRHCYFDYWIYSPEFLQKMHENSEGFVTKISNDYFAILSTICPLMEQINQEIISK